MDSVTTTAMLYDIARESANRVRGVLIDINRNAPTAAERDAAWRRLLEIGEEIKAGAVDDRAEIIAQRERWREEYRRLTR